MTVKAFLAVLFAAGVLVVVPRAGAPVPSGCVTADLNGDRRPDVVCIGASTANLKWYENVGKR
jgi:hypothetical protein